MSQSSPGIDRLRSEEWKQKREYGPSEYNPFNAMSDSEKRALCTIRNLRIVAAVLAVALVITWAMK